MANAVKAAGKGGRTGLRLAVRKDRAVLTVWDNGPGLPPPEPEEKGPLYRPDGPGLGLRVARSIAAAHGGAIVFEQREDRGCRAVVSLPIRPPEGARCCAPRPWAATGAAASPTCWWSWRACCPTAPSSPGSWSEFWKKRKKLFTNGEKVAIIIRHVEESVPCAPVAQLDRASDSGSEGWGFESLRAYQKK